MAAPLLRGAKGSQIPVGLELYSVREQLKADQEGTLKKIAAQGYQCVEFYAPYHDWTIEHAKATKKQLDDLGIHCYSTHNALTYFDESSIAKTIQLNQILGAKFAIVSSAGKRSTLDDWKQVADALNKANDKLKSEGLTTGYHNHQAEFKPIDGTRPMEILAKNTEKRVVLQLDVGTCVEVGSDPVAWVKANPGRIRCMHCKEWSPKNAYAALFGEGVTPWKELFAAAESVGGVEFYLIEQEGSRFSEFETAQRCLDSWKALRSPA